MWQLSIKNTSTVHLESNLVSDTIEINVGRGFICDYLLYQDLQLKAGSDTNISYSTESENVSVIKLLEHRQGKRTKVRNKDTVWSKQTADRNHMLPTWLHTMYSHFTPYPAQENDCQSHFLLLLSPSLLWMAEEKSASDGKAPSWICLSWPMLDLRGLISLNNKTKRVNVLIVADGAGILGKCVKLVLTSGSHSSPPCCDLLLPSLYTPLSSVLPTYGNPFLLWPCPSTRSLLLFICVWGDRDMGLNGETKQLQDKAELVEWCKITFHSQISMKAKRPKRVFGQTIFLSNLWSNLNIHLI